MEEALNRTSTKQLKTIKDMAKVVESTRLKLPPWGKEKGLEEDKFGYETNRGRRGKQE